MMNKLTGGDIMDRKRGFTLIEVIIAMAIVGIIAAAFLPALSGIYKVLVGTKTFTENVFKAQKNLEEEIESVRNDLGSDVTPPGRTDITLFDEIYSGNYSVTVAGYPREAAVSGDLKLFTMIAETRADIYPVPSAIESVLRIRMSGTAIPGNYAYVNIAGMTLRANSTIDENGVFLVNRHEWFVSRAGFNIPMVSWELVDKDYDLGRLYPLFPNDYIPIPVKSNTDQFSQSDLNTILNEYMGRHIIYTITPYADSGKKGQTIFSNPIFLTGPAVRDGLMMHLDASLVSREDTECVAISGDSIYLAKWKSLVPGNNDAVQGSTSHRPLLSEVQYPEDLFVWGKSAGGNHSEAFMRVDPFSPGEMDEFTVVIVAKTEAVKPSGTNMISGGSGYPGGWHFGWNDTGSLGFMAGEEDEDGEPAVLDGGYGLDGRWHVFALSASEGILRISMDGSERATGTYTGPVDFSPLHIDFENIETAEVLIYSRDLSSGSDMQSVTDYLYGKYYPDPDEIGVRIIFLKPLNELTINKGQPYFMPAVLPALMSNGTTQNIEVTWSDIIDTTVTGTQTSTATADMDASKTVSLTVHVVEIDHILPLPEITVEKGMPYTLPATLEALMSNGITKQVAVTWSGSVPALDVGRHTLTAVSDLDPEKTVDLTVNVVPVAVTGVSLNVNDITMTRTDTRVLTAIIMPADAGNKGVIWESSDPDIVSVSGGTVTALLPGEAVVTVTTEDGGFTDQCTVRVLPVYVTGVVLNKTSLSLTTGGMETLTAMIVPGNADNKGVTWASSNPAAAAVDTSGTVTAAGPGTALITVRTDDGGYTASCAVNVTQPVSGVSLDRTSLLLYRNQVFALTAEVLPANASNKSVTWHTSNTSVARVANGVVTAAEPGSAVITVRTVDGGYEAYCSVEVREALNAESVSGTARRFTIRFSKNIQSASITGYTANITISGRDVTFERVGQDFPNNTNITVNVSDTDGMTRTAVAARTGWWVFYSWSIQSQY